MSNRTFGNVGQVLLAVAMLMRGEKARLYLQLGSDRLGNVAVSKDERLALTQGNGAAILWSAASGRELRRFQNRAGAVASVAFSPDGRWLLTGGQDSLIRLWDVATGREIRRMEGGRKSVRSRFRLTDGVG